MTYQLITFLAALPVALTAALGAPERPAPAVGVLVETTAGGAYAAAVPEARAAVAGARRRGGAVQLRAPTSPSDSLAAAATLATRGARTLIVVGADEAAVVGPLRTRSPGVRIIRAAPTRAAIERALLSAR